MQVGDIIDLSIEKLNSEGNGLARFNGFVFFVKNSSPGDVLKCKITKLNKSYGFAQIEEIIEPSQYRVEPKCKLHKLCGACNLQHIDYSAQLKFKKEIVKDTLKTETPINDVINVGDGYNYRAKVQYPVSSKAKSPRILAGYYQKASHELINIKYCPIQPSEIDNVIEFIKERAQANNISAYNEKTYLGSLRHIVIRYSDFNNKMLALLVINDNKITPALNKLAREVYENFENVIGISVNFNTAKNNVILGKKSQNIIGEDYIEEALCDKIFKISGDTFFQVNPKCANLMFNYIKEFVKNNFDKPSILDAYAGIAAFGIALCDIAGDVVSVELNAQSIKKAEENIKHHNITNITPICADTSEYLNNCYRTFDITILDPPRKGCEKEGLKKILSITNKMIIYVSCNPATLARDIQYLQELGCQVKEIQPFDMFPQTAHIETVAFIKLP